MEERHIGTLNHIRTAPTVPTARTAYKGMRSYWAQSKGERVYIDYSDGTWRSSSTSWWSPPCFTNCSKALGAMSAAATAISLHKKILVSCVGDVAVFQQRCPPACVCRSTTRTAQTKGIQWLELFGGMRYLKCQDKEPIKRLRIQPDDICTPGARAGARVITREIEREGFRGRAKLGTQEREES